MTDAPDIQPSGGSRTPSRPMVLLALIALLAVAVAAVAFWPGRSGRDARVATETVAPAGPGQVAAACSMPVPEGDFPDARFGSLLIPSADGVIVHGGRGVDLEDRADAWGASCSGWAKREHARTPPVSAPGEAASVFDDARQETVLLTATGATWAFDGADWSQKSTKGPALAAPLLAYDSARTEVVAFGGTGRFGEAPQTWAWNGHTWSRRSVKTTPPLRQGAAMVYDSARATTYLFGGVAAHDGLSDTWAWDGESWTELSPDDAFPAGPMAAAFDPVRQVTVALVFNGVGHLGETWIWDGDNWTKKTTVHTPPRRNYGSIVYAPALARVVLFGGKVNTYVNGAVPHTEETIVNDLWTWDGSDWTQVH